jgi:hypothetical protein
VNHACVGVGRAYRPYTWDLLKLPFVTERGVKIAGLDRRRKGETRNVCNYTERLSPGACLGISS